MALWCNFAELPHSGKFTVSGDAFEIFPVCYLWVSFEKDFTHHITNLTCDLFVLRTWFYVRCDIISHDCRIQDSSQFQEISEIFFSLPSSFHLRILSIITNLTYILFVLRKWLQGRHWLNPIEAAAFRTIHSSRRCFRNFF